MTILINNEITIQGTVDECLEFLKKYKDDNPRIYNIPDDNDKIKLPFDYSDCSDCDFYKTLEEDKIYFGDTPCNLCSKRQPLCNDFDKI